MAGAGARSPRRLVSAAVAFKSLRHRTAYSRSMLDHFRRVFLRDIDTLRREVELYPDDLAPWKEVPGLPNTGGTLAVHLVGNLRHYVGAQLGKTGYVRDREGEFSVRGLSRQAILQLVAAARREVGDALVRLDPSALEAPFPAPILGQSLPAGLFLLHLAAHLSFHTGQIDYHRRAVTGASVSAGTVSLPALFETAPDASPSPRR